MKNGVLCLAVCMVTVLAGSQQLYAQITVQHQPPTVLDRSQNNVLEFFVPGITQNDVLEATIFYRLQSDLGYTQQEVFYQNGSFRITLTPEMLQGTGLEYYFELRLRNINQDVFFPQRLPSQDPVGVEIVDRIIPEQEIAEGIDFTVLSPKPGTGLAKNDAFIAIALYYDASTVEPGEFRLMIDGVDVTGEADTSAYFISYVPKNLGRGNHTVTLEYVTDRGPLAVTSSAFKIVDPDRASFQSFEPQLIPTGRVELTARNQVISGDPNNALTGRTYLNGSYGLFRYSINAYLTSQESNRLQPQNRYGIDMSLGKWWRFQAGHVYPNLSKFTISGRRIYGINTSLHLLWEGLNIQFVHGEINRKVTNLYSSVSVDTVYAGGIPQDTTYTLGFRGGGGRGTFKRKITGGRIGIGNPRKFQFGIQALKVEDDTSSIFNITDFNNLINGPSSLYNNLTSDDISRLYAQPSILRIDGGSPKPRGNLVAGADIKFSLDENKVRFQTETVASVLNNNIYNGPLDSLRAADLGFEGVNPGDLTILNDLSRLIIINENVTVLPIKFSFDEDSLSDPEPFFPTSVLGSNTELSFNYPRNTFRIQYRWVGPEFVSLANSTIRKDIAGFTFTDRFSLLSNQLYITMGMEFLKDNITNAKNATTKTNTYRSNVSWYPINQQLPRVTGGFRFRTRNNDVTRFNPAVPEGFENVAVQNLRISGSDTLTTPTPRLNNTLNLNFSITQEVRVADIVNDVTFGFSTLKTKDEAFRFGAVTNNSFSLNVVSRFQNLPLRTQIGTNYNSTQSGGDLLNIDIFGIYLAGTYFLMDGQLSLNSRLAFNSNTSVSRTLQVENSNDTNFYNDYYVLSSSSTRSDFGTYVFIAGAEYKITNNHSLVFDSNFTNVSGMNSLNDRTVQLRYIFRF